VNTASWRAPADLSRSGVSRATPRGRRDDGQAPGAPRSSAQLEVLFVSEIVAAHAEVSSIMEAAFSGMSPRGPDLVSLRGDLRRCLDRLVEALLGFSVERDAIDALVPFVFFVDEQVEHCLAVSTEPGGDSWFQLQRDLFGERRAEGGDVFYERAEELLAETTPRTTVIAAYLFCLKANFRGRLADAPEEVVERWARALAEKLPSGTRRGGVPVSSWRAPRRTMTYFVLAVAAIVGFHFLVSAWAYLR
jgi:type VI protein secretion system component VasF